MKWCINFKISFYSGPFTFIRGLPFIKYSILPNSHNKFISGAPDNFIDFRSMIFKWGHKFHGVGIIDSKLVLISFNIILFRTSNDNRLPSIGEFSIGDILLLDFFIDLKSVMQNMKNSKFVYKSCSKIISRRMKCHRK